MTDRAAAQARADQVQAFRRELAALEREGVFVPDDALRARLHAHHDALLAGLARTHDVDTTAGTARLSLGMRIASLLGAVALVAAVVLFFLRVWGDIPLAAQVALLAGAPLLLLAATEAAARRRGARPLAELFAGVAVGAFVLELVAFQQIFALPESPHGFLAWGLLGLALGHGYGFRTTGSAGVALLSWWGILALSDLFGTWQDPVHAPDFAVIVGAVAFVVGGLARLKPGEMRPPWRGVGLAVTFAGLLLVSVNGRTNGFGWPAHTAETVYQLATLAASVAVIAVGVRRGWRETTVIGTGAFLLLAMLKSVDWLWDWLPRWLYFLVIGLAALLVVLVLRRWRLRGSAT